LKSSIFIIVLLIYFHYIPFIINKEKWIDIFQAMKVIAHRKMEGKSLIENRLLPIMPVKGGKMAHLVLITKMVALILILNQRTGVIHKMKTMDLEG